MRHNFFRLYSQNQTFLKIAKRVEFIRTLNRVRNRVREGCPSRERIREGDRDGLPLGVTVTEYPHGNGNPHRFRSGNAHGFCNVFESSGSTNE